MERTRFTGETATQMLHARRGAITPEMTRVAEREETAPETIRDEVARGRMVIPANVNHRRRLEPMAIGIDVARARSTPTSATPPSTRHVDEELEKLHTAVHFGADTVMDLSTGGDIDEIRQAIIDASPVPIGTVPIYQVMQQRQGRVEDLDRGRLLDMVEHQAKQGVDYMTIHAGVLLRVPAAASSSASPASSAAAARCMAQWMIAPPQAEPAVHALRRDLRDHARVRRDLQPGRRPAAGLPGRRQRRRPVRRARRRWAS